MRGQDRILLLFIFLFAPFLAYCQTEKDTLNQISTGQDELFAESPEVKGNRKAKGIEINYVQTAPFVVKSFSRIDNLNDATAKIKTTRSLEFKGKIPLVLKQRTKPNHWRPVQV